MLSGQVSTQVGRQVLVGDSIGSSDRQSVIGAVAHHWGRKFEHFKVKSELDNLKIKGDSGEKSCLTCFATSSEM